MCIVCVCMYKGLTRGMRGQGCSSSEMEAEVIMQSGHMYKWNDVEQTDKDIFIIFNILNA